MGKVRVQLSASLASHFFSVVKGLLNLDQNSPQTDPDLTVSSLTVYMCYSQSLQCTAQCKCFRNSVLGH